MPPGRTYTSPALIEYLLETSLREPEVLASLREETQARSDRQMQIDPEQGQFMALLVAAVGARRVVEVGTFTGYSSLAMALALPEDGLLVACDRDEDVTAIARRYWSLAGVDDRIELRLGDAKETLEALLESGEAGSYDLAFIDADKGRYEQYYELLLELVRSGGLILVDNVLWGGRVADPEADDADTESIRAFNRKLHVDDRIDLSMLPVGDGLTVARVRA